MYEENRKFSWTNFFIKGIIVIIFVLFTVWLLSLSTKGLSSSLNVLTDDIFSENIEKMKEVGKSYFTTERLPQKVGEIETLSLAKMYDERLILELKDKNGDACSARNSYVSVEKLENEYRMKVYLECGSEEDYIIVIMGCYDYCDGSICEKEETTSTKNIEYQYSKTTGGKWTDYGKWSEWSKVSVTENSYRKVEKKTVKEDYSYDKEVTESVYVGELTCPQKQEFTVTRDGEKCTYTKSVSSTTESECPVVSGYELTKQNGFTCSYTKIDLDSYTPSCDSTYGGYAYNYKSGFTCNYKKTVTSSYQVPYTVSKTCYTTKTTTVIPCTGCAPQYQEVQVPYDCSYTAYKTQYSTNTYTKSYTLSCKDGYSKSDGKCVEDVTTKEEQASCPSGFEPSGNSCLKVTTVTEKGNAQCSVGYIKDGKCYKDQTSTVKVTGYKDVTYYRYKVREYVGGTTDYKWSKSNNDQTLIKAGYKLTGKTR